MLKKAITIILALAMMSGTSVFASNETEESNNATQIEQSSEVTAFESDISSYQEEYSHIHYSHYLADGEK